MNVLIVSHGDWIGGAGRAAYRTHISLRKLGVESSMLVQQKHTLDPSVIGPYGVIKKSAAKIRLFADQKPLLFYPNHDGVLFSPSFIPSPSLIAKINATDADVVNLHWVTGGMFSIEDFLKIKKPIVWTMHDNWLFTGGCHVKWECERYRERCGYCPRLNSKREYDLSRLGYARKEKLFRARSDIKIVGPSQWITERAKESPMLKECQVQRIANPIDTELFKPIDKRLVRSLLNLPQDKRLILFGANSALRDKNKGYHLLAEALSRLSLENTELLVFGSSQPEGDSDLPVRAHFVGHLHDEFSLVALYNAADIFVVPSLQENLSYAIMESLACGVPVAAFHVGGNNDLIGHKQNGYLASPFDVEDLARGISWGLGSDKVVQEKCREMVVENFSEERIGREYLSLFNGVG